MLFTQFSFHNLLSHGKFQFSARNPCGTALHAASSTPSGLRAATIAIRAVRVFPFRALKSQKLTSEINFCNFAIRVAPFRPESGPESLILDFGGGGARIDIPEQSQPFRLLYDPRIADIDFRSQLLPPPRRVQTRHQ